MSDKEFWLNAYCEAIEFIKENHKSSSMRSFIIDRLKSDCELKIGVIPIVWGPL